MGDTLGSTLVVYDSIQRDKGKISVYNSESLQCINGVPCVDDLQFFFFLVSDGERWYCTTHLVVDHLTLSTDPLNS